MSNLAVLWKQMLAMHDGSINEVARTIQADAVIVNDNRITKMLSGARKKHTSPVDSAQIVYRAFSLMVAHHNGEAV